MAAAAPFFDTFSSQIMTCRFLPAVFTVIALYFGAMPASCAAPEQPCGRKVFFQYNKFRGAELLLSRTANIWLPW